MADPVQVIADLEALTVRLDEASRTLYKKQEEFDKIEELYDDTFNDLLIALLSKFEDEGKRLPGEDVRNALVVKAMREEEPLLFGQYRRLKAELKRGHDLARSIEREIFARQSILSYLKTEAMAA